MTTADSAEVGASSARTRAGQWMFTLTGVVATFCVPPPPPPPPPQPNSRMQLSAAMTNGPIRIVSSLLLRGCAGGTLDGRARKHILPCLQTWSLTTYVDNLFDREPIHSFSGYNGKGHA